MHTPADVHARFFGQFVQGALQSIIDSAEQPRAQQCRQTLFCVYYRLS
jgi:hypothetical protein